MQEAEVPARRNRLTLSGDLVVAIEGGDHRFQRRLGDDVLVLDLAAEFLLQRFDIDRHDTSSSATSNVANPLS